MSDQKPYRKYERRRLDVRTYRAQHRNVLRAEGKLSQKDPKLAKTTYQEHPALKNWPEGTTEYEMIVDEYAGLDLRDAVALANA